METDNVSGSSVFWAQSDLALSLRETWTHEVVVLEGSVKLETLDSTSNLFYVVEILWRYAGLDACYIDPA